MSLSLDAHVVDVLMPDLVGHDRHASAFVTYLFLWRRTHGADRDDLRISLADIAEGTGLSKRAVQEALNRLVRRQLASVSRESITAVPVYRVLRPWRSWDPSRE